ncbi:glycosyltransferase [Butyrivibrio sp. YAB3001]|uniref:glycosyltransferase n=1 Tax=Butyrivibrio sp. YAB3001 TaxID=1520812 RepID=UPI0008F63483|nr:glycosyltransferase [Butyrivibrio sp. YAB3001]SFC80391.1 Glycosyltransferase involved in cell wall bisynthesis [Butyrivibrio sp. YAB3001]
MNVLYVNTRYVGGGAEKISRVLYKKEKEYGCNTYFLEGKETSGEVYHVYSHNGLVRGINYVYSVVTDNARRIDFYTRYKVKALIKKYHIDIIHFHNIHGNYIGYSDMKYFQKYCKVVWTLHDMWPITAHCGYSLKCDKWKYEKCFKCAQKDLYPSVLFRNTKRLFRNKESAYGESVTYVTPSRWLFDLLEESFLSSQKRVLISNGVSLSIFKYVSKDFSNDRPISILFGANKNDSKYKNISFLIRVLNKVREKNKFVLHIYGGDVPDMLSTEYKVVEHGYITDEKIMAQIYAECDVFILPSAAENYSCALLESLSCGTPAIASNSGGNSEIVNSKNGWVFSLDDEKELLSIIETLSFRELSVRNTFLKYDRERFDEDTMLKQYFELYRSIY